MWQLRICLRWPDSSLAQSPSSTSEEDYLKIPSCMILFTFGNNLSVKMYLLPAMNLTNTLSLSGGEREESSISRLNLSAESANGAAQFSRFTQWNRREDGGNGTNHSALPNFTFLCFWVLPVTILFVHSQFPFHLASLKTADLKSEQLFCFNLLCLVH